MGIGLQSFAGLVNLTAQEKLRGSALMLGRQKFRLVKPGTQPRRRINTTRAQPFQAVLDRHGIHVDAKDLVQDDAYAETMFKGLGFDVVESLDFSEYQKATRLWDLNVPVPQDWHQSYDFIFDGGTLEHVFSPPQAFENVFHMLKVGGVFASVTPLNGFPGHGLYQFTPELVWTVWQRRFGCKVLSCHSFTDSKGILQELPDPNLSGTRLDVKPVAETISFGAPEPLKMHYSVRKTLDSAVKQQTLQSDYETLWKKAETV